MLPKLLSPTLVCYHSVAVRSKLLYNGEEISVATISVAVRITPPKMTKYTSDIVYVTANNARNH